MQASPLLDHCSALEQRWSCMSGVLCTCLRCHARHFSAVMTLTMLPAPAKVQSVGPCVVYQHQLSACYSHACSHHLPCLPLSQAMCGVSKSVVSVLLSQRVQPPPCLPLSVGRPSHVALTHSATPERAQPLTSASRSGSECHHLWIRIPSLGDERCL